MFTNEDMDMSTQILSIPAVIGLMACSPQKAQEAAPAPAEHTYAFESADLVGTWATTCFPSPKGEGNKKLVFKMTEGEWDLDYMAFNDDACSVQFLTVNIKGTYSLEGASPVEDGAREATFGFASKTVTGHMEDALDVINGACVVEGTAVGTPLDIAGGCAGLGAYPIAECTADHNIVKLVDGVLHFGVRPQDNNICTADKRPTSFEGGAQVTKEQTETAEPTEQSQGSQEAAQPKEGTE